MKKFEEFLKVVCLLTLAWSVNWAMHECLDEEPLPPLSAEELQDWHKVGMPPLSMPAASRRVEIFESAATPTNERFPRAMFPALEGELELSRLVPESGK